MKKISFAIIVLTAVFILSFFGYQKRRELYYSVFGNTATGKISDFSNGAPLEMIKFYFSDSHSYSSWKGKYVFWEPKKTRGVSFDIPEVFEKDFKSGDLEIKEVGLLKTEVVQDFFLVPSLLETVRRTLAFEEKPPLGKLDMAGKYKNLWGYMVDESKELWKDETEFANTFYVHNTILIKLGREMTDFEITGAPKLLPSWTDPISGNTFNDISEVAGKRFFAGGSEEDILIHLKKVDGFWHIFFDKDRESIWQFDQENDWVLKQR